jgi:hypothetical protein
MSQQHARFEEEFHQTPPSASFQAETTAGSPSLQGYSVLAGQKLVVAQGDTQWAPGPGQRLALAIVSLVFVFLTFIIALIVVAIVRDDLFPIAPLAISFALLFAVVTVVLNILFNRNH